MENLIAHLGGDEKAKRDSESQDEKRARLSAGDIALIPGGANGPNALPFAELKAAVGQIKSINVTNCRASLAGDDRISASGTLPNLQARLLLCAAFKFGLGRLPFGWISSKSHGTIRAALGVEAAYLLDTGFVGRLGDAQRVQATAVCNYWLQRAANEAQASSATGSAASASESSESTVSNVVTDLFRAGRMQPQPSARAIAAAD